MPSSDRPAPSRDRAEPKDACRDSGRARTQDAPIEPPQYFDPSEPWDAQSAEALTRHYETGEGYLHQRPGGVQARRRPPLPPLPPAGERGAHHNTDWLEARLADIAERLQGSLAEINPGNAIADLNHRLDAIEERFAEAVSQVAKRSDLDGLRLIEAHVMELAAHVEQTRGPLGRIDAIDSQMQGLVRRLEEGDHQRLDALEKLLQAYVVEWRRGDERTASALQNLESVINRVGESIDAIEEQKPAPDLTVALLGAHAIASDPLSQVYADAARVLEPMGHRASLDAADYAPKVKPGSDAAEFELAPLPGRASIPAETEAGTAGDSLPSPSFLISMMRTKLRQALGMHHGEHSGHRTSAATDSAPDKAPPARRTRSSVLLTGGIALFAATGYLLVDVFMTASAAQRRAVEAEQTARPAEAAATASSRTGAGASERGSEDAAPPAPGRIEAIGGAIAAAFRPKDEVTHPSIKSTASIWKDAPPPREDAQTPATAALPMTIGPASLRQAAMRGDSAAQVEVASRYATGQGVERDLRLALQWYSRAATQGLPVAQYRLAALYERGLGTSQDAERARVWYARAAEQGNVKAMHNLAVLSVSGGRTDYATAVKWFTLAAGFGLTDSQVNLAILYQNGLGVPKDLTRAYKWLALAGRGGDSEAAARKAQVGANLSLAELESADAMIAAWRARTPEPAANEVAAAAPTLDLGQ